jgi:hypothetical protein
MEEIATVKKPKEKVKRSEKPRKIYKPRWIAIHTYPEDESCKLPHL